MGHSEANVIQYAIYGRTSIIERAKGKDLARFRRSDPKNTYGRRSRHGEGKATSAVQACAGYSGAKYWCSGNSGEGG